MGSAAEGRPCQPHDPRLPAPWAEDFTIRTALLENRFLAGDRGLAAKLNHRLWKDLFKGSAPEFIEAKLTERDIRHEKQGGQRYMVEPNVKEGKGGLRDLQSLFWIAKYLHRVQDTSPNWCASGMFTEEEYDKFSSAHEFPLGGALPSAPDHQTAQ